MPVLTYVLAAWMIANGFMSFILGRLYELPALRVGQLTAALVDIEAVAGLMEPAPALLSMRLKDGTRKMTRPVSKTVLDPICDLAPARLVMHFESHCMLSITGDGHNRVEVQASADTPELMNEILGRLEKSPRLVPAITTEKRPVALAATSDVRAISEPGQVARAPQGIDPGDLTIGQILHSLRPRHVVAIVGVSFAVVAAVAVGSYWVGTTVTEMRLHGAAPVASQMASVAPHIAIAGSTATATMNAATFVGDAARKP